MSCEEKSLSEYFQVDKSDAYLFNDRKLSALDLFLVQGLWVLESSHDNFANRQVSVISKGTTSGWLTRGLKIITHQQFEIRRIVCGLSIVA